MDVARLQEVARDLKGELGLSSSPVGVRFLRVGEAQSSEGAIPLTGHRYCQALMKARHGLHVTLDADGIACPAAAAAFGFRPLPEGLRTGAGLVGFGIVDDERTARAMFEGMTTLPQGSLREVYLFPLETARMVPDVVVVEDEVEKLMWIALAYLNASGGNRVEGTTAILQAVCVDVTIIPYVRRRFNVSMGCYGCRDATDIGAHEAVLGFPIEDLAAIADSVLHLSRKAIPNARSRKSLALLRGRESQQG